MVQGYKWLYIAVEAGDTEAQKTMNVVKQYLSKKEIQDAIDMAKAEKITKNN